MYYIYFCLKGALFKDQPGHTAHSFRKYVLTSHGHAAVGRPLGTLELVEEMGSSDRCTDR